MLVLEYLVVYTVQSSMLVAVQNHPEAILNCTIAQVALLYTGLRLKATGTARQTHEQMLGSGIT